MEFVINNDVEKVFLDYGIDLKDADEYLRNLLMKAIQQIFNSLPEMMCALKSGVASEQEIMTNMYEKGKNLGSDVRKQYDEQKKGGESRV